MCAGNNEKDGLRDKPAVAEQGGGGAGGENHGGTSGMPV